MKEQNEINTYRDLLEQLDFPDEDAAQEWVDDVEESFEDGLITEEMRQALFELLEAKRT